ncbi:MAG: tRNA (N(6)-L-threonylcarbamoyladenosine(37)-C(2))-methylthiotransferase [Thermoproteota archaeon]|nr:tRNA (N(6)-L-threonylcarbamoyladenosine(37)-C(2))-methylthiotransferase [Thermoproteota archaeon]
MIDNNINSISKFRSLKPKLIDIISLLNKDNNNNLSTDSTSAAAVEDESNKIDKKKQQSFWIEGYGCSASFADMEMIAGQLKNNGFEIANNPKQASISIIVTCSVKEKTEHRMIHRIKRLSKNNKPLVIAGCLPSADQQLVEKINPNASLLGPNTINKTLEIVNSTLNGQKSIFLQNSEIEKINYPKIRINPVISIIEIASGCLSECSFCQTKLAKGGLQSYRIGNIINQINQDLKTGTHEIWLTSTDNGCYGRDIGTNLAELLKKCVEIEKEDFKIRVGMMNPMYLKDMINDLVDIYSKSNKIFKFIHIPVQSGSEKVLRKMKRGHTAKTFNEIIRRFREKIPDMTIATDIITGFPEETDEDFELTLKMIQELEPDIINSSKFSPRPGTSASKLKRIDQEMITYRSERLHSIIKNIAKKRNSHWLNWEGNILIDEFDNGNLKGRNEYYKSIIIKNVNKKILTDIKKEESYYKNNESFVDPDGGLYSMNLNNHNNNLPLGKTIKVKIIGYSNHTLEGIQII